MARDENLPLLEQLVHSLIKIVNDNHSTMYEEMRLLREDIKDSSKENKDDIEDVRHNIADHEKRISKIEHNWGTFTLIVTGAAGILATALHYIAHFLGLK